MLFYVSSLEQRSPSGFILQQMFCISKNSYQSHIFSLSDVLKVKCSEDRDVDVRSGENVTIHCKASANAQHRWTKVM